MKKQIVRALAGKEAGRIFLVTGVTEDGRLLLADGRTRKTGHPKKKKVKHTEMIREVDLPGGSETEGMLTDRAIRRIIKEVNIFFETRKE